MSMKNEDMDPNQGQGSSPMVDDKEDEELIACIGEGMLIDSKELLVGLEIGQTSLFTIHQAKYKNQTVAVKIMKGSEASTVQPGFRKRVFLREVQMYYLSQHENVVTFIGASTKPRMQIVMELLRGGTLADYCSNRLPDVSDQRVVIGFAIQISQAMEHIHKMGILHRDLKLSNVLLTEDGKKAKVADFGLALILPADRMMHANIGTIFYMAPEVYSNPDGPNSPKTKQYDFKADVYSFSTVLWKLLVHRGPFKIHKGMAELKARALEIYTNKERPSLENIPQGLVPLLESCWEEDPRSRPNFSEITRRLLEFLNTLH